jgi:hypothetical protein
MEQGTRKYVIAAVVTVLVLLVLIGAFWVVE